MEVSQEQADWLPFRLGCQVVIIGLNDKGCQVVTPLPWKPGEHFATITIVPADLRADDGEEVPLETFELPFRRS
jgi:hypothetical protein